VVVEEKKKEATAEKLNRK